MLKKQVLYKKIPMWVGQEIIINKIRYTVVELKQGPFGTVSSVAFNASIPIPPHHEVISLTRDLNRPYATNAQYTLKDRDGNFHNYEVFVSPSCNDLKCDAFFIVGINTHFE